MTRELETRIAGISGILETNAKVVDFADLVSSQQFSVLADAGLYGVFAPLSTGGLDLDLSDLCAVVEELASACLTTTFVWIQHFRLLRALLDPTTPDSIRELLPLAVSGQIKGGVALGGLLPGPPRLRATETRDGWHLNGEAPWVSGWGIVDLLFLTARQSDDTVVSFVVDAVDQPGLGVTRCRLSAMNASSTVQLTFDDLRIPEDRYVGSQPYAPGLERPEGLRVNGSLALGVTRRCCELLGPTSLTMNSAVVERTSKRSKRRTSRCPALVQPNSQCALLTCWPYREGVVRRFPVTSPNVRLARRRSYSSSPVARRSRMRFSIS